MAIIPYWLKEAYPYLVKFGSVVVAQEGIGLLKGGEQAMPPDDWTKLAQPVLDTADTLLSNYLPKYFENAVNQQEYGFNGDLEKLFNKALQATLDDLSRQYRKRHPEADSEVVKAFFGELTTATLPTNLDAATVQLLLNTYVLDKRDFLGQWLAVTEAEPTADSIIGDLIEFLVTEFPEKLQHWFLQQLKNPAHENGRLAYMVYLAEQTLRLGHTQQSDLENVHRLLTAIADQDRLGRDLQGQAQRVLTDKLRALHYQVQHVGDTTQRTEQKVEALHTQQRPSFYLPGITSEEQTIFEYKARYTDFFGREEEMQLLDGFARDTPEPLSWLLLCGLGGVGKSRLALHYCRHQEKRGEEAWFLEATEPELTKLGNYTFPKSTLVVLDYVAAYAPQVARTIRHLHHRQQQLGVRVRLLLLEREAQGEWWKEFEKNEEVWDCRFRGTSTASPVLRLPGLGDDQHWQLLEAVYRRRRPAAPDLPHQREEVLQELYRLDPQRRPLFALFVGVALADGEYERLKTWNAHTLLGYILEREKTDVWHKHPTYERHEPRQHENLLVLTTLTKKLSQRAVNHWCQRAASQWLPAHPDPELYGHMAEIRQPGDEETAEVLAQELPRQRYAVARPKIWLGLQPDLLGEYFVLTRLGELLHSDNEAQEEVAIALVQTAWEEHPTDTRDFLEKALRDYAYLSEPEYEQLGVSSAYRFLLEITPDTAAREEAWSQWGWLQLTGTVKPFAVLGTYASRKIYYEKLKNSVAAQATPVKVSVRQQAQAAFFMATSIPERLEMSNLGDYLNISSEYYDDLQMLAQTWPDDAILALRLVETAYYMIGLCHTCNNISMSENYYINLKKFNTERPASNWATKVRLANVEAQAALRLSFYLKEEAGNELKAAQYQEQGQTLYKQFPTDGLLQPSIRELPDGGWGAVYLWPAGWPDEAPDLNFWPWLKV